MQQSKEIDYVESFCFQGSISDKSGDSSADAVSRINNVHNAFVQLSLIWESSNISRRIHTHIIGHYNISVRISDLVSITTCIVCVYISGKLRGIHRRNIFIFSF